MTKTITAIIIIALIWHCGIIVILHFKNSQQPKPSLKRLLRLAELDLLQDLKEKLERLSREKLERKPYKIWNKQTQNWIMKIREKYD